MNNELKYKLSLQDLFSKSMQNAVSETKKMDSAMSGIGSKIRNVAAVIGVGALGREIIQTGAAFERAEIQLKTLLKSSTEAKRVFNDLKDESTRSPFGFDTLLQGNAALISTGLSAKDAKGDFNALANAIAATGGTEDTLSRMVFNLQQIKNVGQATAVDIKQFGMAGINIYSILDDYYKKNHISLEKQKGDYSQITGALKLASEEGGRYFGALDNLSNSSSGKLSNLADSWKNFQYELFNRAKPTIDSVVSSLTKLMNWTIKNLSTIKEFAKGIGIVVGLYLSYNAILKLNIWYNGLSNAAIILNTLATEGLTGAQVALNIAMEANPIGLVIAAVGALVLAYQGLKAVMNSVKDEYRANDSAIAEANTSELNSVNALADSYKGLSKEKAIAKAISERKGILGDELVGLSMEREGLTGDAFAANSKRQQILESQISYLEKNGNSISNDYSKNKLASAKAGKAGGGSSSSSVGSSTDVSSARPQSLIININDGLVKQMNIYAATIKESAGKIREEVSKALLETANDANLAAR